MTANGKLTFFTSSAVETLFFELKEIHEYWEFESVLDELRGSSDNLLHLDWEFGSELPELRGRDGDDAVHLHHYLGEMSPVQSSDNRLWTYLSSIQFREYTRRRWPLKSGGDLQSRATSRWLMRQSSLNSISRNATSRLWFAASRLHDPEMERPLSSEQNDPYAYVRFVFEVQDRYQQIFERSSLFHRELAFVVLDHLSEHYTRKTGTYVKELMKEVLAATGYRELPVLDRAELVALVATIGESLEV